MSFNNALLYCIQYFILAVCLNLNLSFVSFIDRRVNIDLSSAGWQQMCKQLVTSYTSVVLLSASLREMIIIQMAGVE